MDKRKLMQIIDNVIDENQCLGSENIADAIISYFQPKQEIDQAIQQIIGFVEAKSHGDLESLIQSMGLTKEEWLEVRKDSITDKFFIREDIDVYFNIKL